jgi:hypothetical protein
MVEPSATFFNAGSANPAFHRSCTRRLMIRAHVPVSWARMMGMAKGGVVFDPPFFVNCFFILVF